MLRTIFFISLLSANFLGTVSAEEHAHRGKHPDLSDEQKACLKKILGERGSGERPSKEKMETAFKSCNIEAPKKDEGGGPPPEESASKSE